MSIASDARYRSVDLSFVNHDQDGSEFVQLLAKPSAGAWAVQRTFPVSPGIDQETTWDTALPLYAYDVALRYLQGSVPAVGYESSDPDAWTASTAAGSKGTVTTTSAAATGLAGEYSSVTALLRLTWACAQSNVPFLIEKSTNGVSGWTTVVADLVATAYDYTPAGGELNATRYFRVTPKRGSVAGTTGGATAIYIGVQVGTPTWISGTWDADTGRIALLWNAASQALNYRLEKKVGAGAWTTVGVVSGTSYSYAAQAGESNVTIGFRLTGVNGAIEGSTSTTQNVNTTLVLVSSTLSAATAVQDPPPPPGDRQQLTTYSATFTVPTGDVVANLMRVSIAGGAYTTIGSLAIAATNATIAVNGLGNAGQAFLIIMRAISAAYSEGDSTSYDDSTPMGGTVTGG